jgi:hypothetical protein
MPLVDAAVQTLSMRHVQLVRNNVLGQGWGLLVIGARHVRLRLHVLRRCQWMQKTHTGILKNRRGPPRPVRVNGRQQAAKTGNSARFMQD